MEYICKQCGDGLSGRRRRFCCQAHALKWQAINKPEQRRAATRKYHKKNGRDIKRRKRERRWLREAGVKNFAEFQKLELAKEKTCPICKKIFHSKWPDKKYCGKSCNRVLLNSNAASNRVLKRITCRWCSKVFDRPSRRSQHRYCSDECYNQNIRKRAKELKATWKRGDHNWMARKMRSTIRSAITRQGKHHKKLQLTGVLLGCTFGELKVYLESQFTAGMSWDTYGVKGWHIDHKRPCASFDLSDAEQQRQCFHHTNLQPLWWHENIHKNANWEGANHRK